MALFSRVRQSPFFIKLFIWEYWPHLPLYFLTYVYWLYLSVKARNLFFFSATNPSIHTGGMLGESKIEIYRMTPRELLPETVFLAKGSSPQAALIAMQEQGLAYPVILKPDRGERGFLVSKVHSDKEVLDILNRYLPHLDFILQEFLTHSNEASVLYSKHPHEAKGRVTSVTLKKFLTVTGDGVSTVEELMDQTRRARLQLASMRERQPERLKMIPPKGEEWLLEPIGNHARGTMFINGNHLVDDTFVASYQRITEQLDRISYCRYDLKFETIDDLRNGNIKIMEINGAGADPAHIYDSRNTLFRVWRDLFFHWRILYDIGTANHRLGAPYISLRDAYTTLFAHFRMKREMSKM